MEGFRDTPPKKIGGILIQTIEDYKNSSHSKFLQDFDTQRDTSVEML